VAGPAAGLDAVLGVGAGGALGPLSAGVPVEPPAVLSPAGESEPAGVGAGRLEGLAAAGSGLGFDGVLGPLLAGVPVEPLAVLSPAGESEPAGVGAGRLEGLATAGSGLAFDGVLGALSAGVPVEPPAVLSPAGESEPAGVGAGRLEGLAAAGSGVGVFVRAGAVEPELPGPLLGAAAAGRLATGLDSLAGFGVVAASCWPLSRRPRSDGAGSFAGALVAEERWPTCVAGPASRSALEPLSERGPSGAPSPAPCLGLSPAFAFRGAF